MDKKEIEKRIEICEERAKGYREVGKNFIADKYDNEKSKWEKLLSDLDLLNERKIKDLLDYKKGYYRQKEVIDKVRNNLEKDISVIKNVKMSNKEIVSRLEQTNRILKEVSK